MSCAHHWIVDDGIGATKGARCKLCRARRTFDNRLVELERKDYAAIAGMEKEYDTENTRYIAPMVPRAFR